MNLARITLYSGGCCIEYTCDTIVQILSPLTTELTEWQSMKDWKTQQMVHSIKAQYFIHNEEKKEIRFHSTFLPRVMDALKKHQHFDTFELITPAKQLGDEIDIKLKSFFAPRDRQPEYIDYISNRDQHLAILPAFMGVGKTVCAIASWARMRTRVCLVISPKYKDNWVDSIEDFLDIDIKKDVLYVAGGGALIKYCNSLLEGINPWKIVIFSLNTLQSYLKNYDADKFPIPPEVMFKLGAFGTKTVDEAHQCLHFHALLDMYSNIGHHLFLTATLMQEQEFGARMENTLYPIDSRCEVDPPTNHVSLVSYTYAFSGKVPQSTGAMGYNHAKLETGIFKNKRIQTAYLTMIARVIWSEFIKVREPHHRCLVYFATVDMVDAFEKLAKKLLPNINTVSYLAGENEEKFADAHLIVTTTKKAGTGCDIKDLTKLVQTIAISSKSENYQNLGRLRKVKDESVVTSFIYLACRQIPKHLDYSNKRQKDLKPLIFEERHIQLRAAI